MFVQTDGGRAEAGYKGSTGDCAVRACTIATGQSYQVVYDEINRIGKTERPRRNGKRSNSRTGVYRETVDTFLVANGFKWVSVTEVGQTRKTKMNKDDLPSGILVLRLRKHFAAWIDGSLYDNYDSSKEGQRIVYGYWRKHE